MSFDSVCFISSKIIEMRTRFVVLFTFLSNCMHAWTILGTYTYTRTYINEVTVYLTNSKKLPGTLITAHAPVHFHSANYREKNDRFYRPLLLGLATTVQGCTSDSVALCCRNWVIASNCHPRQSSAEAGFYFIFISPAVTIACFGTRS